MSEQHHRMRWETIGMLAGFVVFLAGVVLLILVFAWTFSLFQGAGQTVSRASAPAVASVLAVMGFKVALLFVMGYVASLIGSKGLQLYGVCRGVSPR
ncbi:MAG TPA: hypothetical protein VM221_11540 [Armatimonadota bacterium]|nr:hypothetical protein [Armatimonadota bacterium]